MRATQQSMSSRRAPLVTLSVIAGALAVYLVPGWANLFVYDRTAILSGEVWRMITAHLVHVSPSHLCYDLLAFSFAGWMIERRQRGTLVQLCGISALLVSVAVLWFAPAVRFYSGLSGVACAAVGYLALLGIRQCGAVRLVCAGALGLMVLKAVWEFATGQLLFASISGEEFIVLPIAHAVGATVGVFTYWFRASHDQVRIHQPFSRHGGAIT